MSRMLQLHAVCSGCLVLSAVLVVRLYNYMMIFCDIGSKIKSTGINICSGGFNLSAISSTYRVIISYEDIFLSGTFYPGKYFVSHTMHIILQFSLLLRFLFKLCYYFTLELFLLGSYISKIKFVFTAKILMCKRCEGRLS